MYEITLPAIDIDNIWCFETFLPLKDNFEIMRFLGPKCKVDPTPRHIQYTGCAGPLGNSDTLLCNLTLLREGTVLTLFHPGGGWKF